MPGDISDPRGTRFRMTNNYPFAVSGCEISSLSRCFRVSNGGLSMRHILASAFTTVIYLCGTVELRRSYDSSYAYLAARSEVTGKEETFCVNYEQWRSRRIADNFESAEILRLGWWGGIINNTNVCIKNGALLYDKQAVAVNYRVEREDGPCALPFVATNISFKGALQFEVNNLASQNASAAVILVEKGRKFISKWADYLFSEFYDPDFNQSTQLPTFFMYKSIFFSKLVGLSENGTGGDVLLRFYRPPNSAWDISMLIIWVIAVFCVAVGGYWAALRKLYEEEASAVKKLDHISSVETLSRKERNVLSDERITTPINCLFIVIVMFIVVGVLMLGFYFRIVMVFIFNIILAIIGTFSVHRCLTALCGSLCRCGHCRICISMNDITRSVFRRDLFNCECCSERPRVVSVLMFLCAVSICITWFVIRRDWYAFVLLDFINIAICIHVLKGIRFPNLKWLTVLLMCMFLYDMFMVFITPFLTKNGCSVMIEVAAGTDCSKTDVGYPIAPINSNIPEKFPMLFQVPRLSDPMLSCIDLYVEKEYHPVILGLGDVIVPGYLISFCFTVDFAVRTRYLYGFVSVVGYGVGLVATFVALNLMETAQPALIYLIPFTLLPIVVLALIRQELGLLWTGNFPKAEGLSYMPRDSGTDAAENDLNSVSGGDTSSTIPLPAHDSEEREI